jgi:hypothetical protein
LVAEIIGVPPVPDTPREKFQVLANAFITTDDGPDRLAEAIVGKMAGAKNGRVLVDGVRQRKTLEQLKVRAGGQNLGLLYVHTPPDLAFRFFREREQADIDIMDFLKLRDAPVEREVEGMIAISDAVLYNWTGKDAYCRAVRKLMAKLLL